MTLSISDSSQALTNVVFDHKYECFTAATRSGFYQYKINPFQIAATSAFSKPLQIAVKLSQENLYALVGMDNVDDIDALLHIDSDIPTAENSLPLMPSNKLVIWDNYTSSVLHQVEFEHPIQDIKSRRSLLVVVLPEQVHVFKMNPFKRLSQLSTGPNPLGICSMAYSGEICIIAYPSIDQGKVCVCYWNNTGLQSLERIVNAHESKLTCLALSFDGSLLATTSENGTVVRVWSTSSRKKIREFRRGTSAARIYSLAFSQNAKFLCCSSDRGTVHVFSLHSQTQNAQSSMSFLGLQYFTSEWSFAKYHGIQTPLICVFGDEKNVLNVVTLTGKFMKLKFNPEAVDGICENIEEREI